MALLVWQGGASATAQVNTGTVGGTWVASETLTTTLTAEDGSTTQSVVSTSTGTDETTDVRDVHLTNLQASVNNLFTQITWASSGSLAITATAKIAGVPFYISDAETSTSGTWSYASTTATSGPHDWNVKENFVDEDGAAASAKPADADTAYIADTTIPILYGLDQQDIELAELQVLPTALMSQIGQPSNSYYLHIDATVCLINSGVSNCWLRGIYTDLKVSGGNGSANYLHLNGTTTNAAFQQSMRGTVTLEGGTFTNIDMFAPAGQIISKTGVTTTSVDMTAGTLRRRSAVTTYNLIGGVVEHRAGNVTTANVWGGSFRYQTAGTITTVTQKGGLVELGNPHSASTAVTTFGITVTNAYALHNGRLREVGWGDITYTNNISNTGGIYEPRTHTTITRADQ